MALIKKLIITVLMLVVLLGTILFTLRNKDMVSVDFYFVQYELTIGSWIILALVTGGILGIIASSFGMVLSGLEKRKLKNRVNRMERIVSAEGKQAR